VASELIDNIAVAISNHTPNHMTHDKAIVAGVKWWVIYGIGLVGLISSVVASNLTGPGFVLLRIASSFLRPACLGSELPLKLNVTRKYKLSNTVQISDLIKVCNNKRLVLVKVLALAYTKLTNG